MADPADIASQYEEMARASAINQARKRTDRRGPVGLCHFCGEPVQGAKLFCDADCQSDDEREYNAMRRDGNL